jgi:hypothetical protein
MNGVLQFSFQKIARSSKGNNKVEGEWGVGHGGGRGNYALQETKGSCHHRPVTSNSPKLARFGKQTKLMWFVVKS